MSTMEPDYKAYLDILRDEDYIKLYSYYSKETTMGILGVARQENPHSGFIRWLLDKNGEHGFGSMPMRKFLETVCLFNDEVYHGDKDLKSFVDSSFWQGKDNLLGRGQKAVLDEIRYGRYEIVDQKIANEVVLRNQRRADIFVMLELRLQMSPDCIQRLMLLIENKVHSTEHDGGKGGPQGQTELYVKDLDDIDTLRNAASSMQESGFDAITTNTVKLFVYLNAFQTDSIKAALVKELNRQTNERCPEQLPKSKEFITLNYQYLLDGVIEPLSHMADDQITQFRVEDYIRCLGQSKITGIDEYNPAKNDGEYLIMAVSSQERKMAISLWTKHYRTILPIISSLANAGENENFTLYEGNRDFWMSMANLYKLIGTNVLKDAAIYVKDATPDEYGEYCDELIRLVENANKATGTRKHRFRFKGVDYESHRKRNIGLLCRDIISDFVKHQEDKGKDGVKLLTDFRGEAQKWNLSWLNEVILFDHEIETMQNNPRAYTPGCPHPTLGVEEFSGSFFSYMDILQKRKEPMGTYDKEYDENNLQIDFPLEICLKDGTKAYVAKYWTLADIGKLTSYLDNNYNCNYGKEVEELPLPKI